jgi:hypothetical protein
VPCGSGRSQSTCPLGRTSRRGQETSHLSTRRKRSGWWESTGIDLNPIGSTLSAYHDRHELQPRHPQLHGQKQTLLAVVDGVWGCHVLRVVGLWSSHTGLVFILRLGLPLVWKRQGRLGIRPMFDGSGYCSPRGRRCSSLRLCICGRATVRLWTLHAWVQHWHEEQKIVPFRDPGPYYFPMRYRYCGSFGLVSTISQSVPSPHRDAQIAIRNMRGDGQAPDAPS